MILSATSLQSARGNRYETYHELQYYTYLELFKPDLEIPLKCGLFEVAQGHRNSGKGFCPPIHLTRWARLDY